MNKKIKRAFALFMAIVAVVLVFAACGNNNSADNGSTTTIRIFNRVNPEVQYGDSNDWVKAVEKAANVKLDIEAPAPSNYNDKLQILMSSGDMPDIIYIFQNDNNYDTWAKNGLFLELDDLIDKYPNLKNNISKELWETARSTSTGKIMAVPKPNIKNHWGFVANDKWLEKLGMSAPETLDEFYELAKAIATQDPDGNGKNDTYILSPEGQTTVGASVWNETFLMAAFNIDAYSYRPDTDGKFKPKEQFEGYYPYLEYMHKLYEEKLIDPEFFINKSGGSVDKLSQNRIGIIQGHDGNVKGLFGKVATAITDFSFYPPLKNPQGERISYNPPSVWGYWAIPSNSKKAEAALKLLDWANSEEGARIMNIGEEGVHYESYDEKLKAVFRTDAQSEKCRKEFSSYTPFSVTYNSEPIYISLCDTQEKLDKYYKDLNNYLDKVTEVDVPSVVSPKLIDLMASNPDLFKKRDQMEVQYITGDISLSELKAFIDGEFLPKTAEAYAEFAKLMEKAYEK